MSNITETVIDGPLCTPQELEAARNLIDALNGGPIVLQALGMIDTPPPALDPAKRGQDSGRLVGVTDAARLLKVEYRVLKSGRQDLPVHVAVNEKGHRLWDSNECRTWGR